MCLVMFETESAHSRDENPTALHAGRGSLSDV